MPHIYKIPLPTLEIQKQLVAEAATHRLIELMDGKINRQAGVYNFFTFHLTRNPASPIIEMTDFEL